MLKKLLILSFFGVCSINVYAGAFVAKAVKTNSVSQLVTANNEVYVQHVGHAMTNPEKSPQQVWIF